MGFLQSVKFKVLTLLTWRLSRAFGVLFRELFVPFIAYLVVFALNSQGMSCGGATALCPVSYSLIPDTITVITHTYLLSITI